MSKKLFFLFLLAIGIGLFLSSLVLAYFRAIPWEGVVNRTIQQIAVLLCVGIAFPLFFRSA